ncbi:MAG: hypothetical protein QOE70_5348 [Chthoniobacter sp.]|jgi:hypothetical protein|nr:hypothetical protein [Chthoniobacter sp.]
MPTSKLVRALPARRIFLSATPGKICEEGDLVEGMKTIFVGTGKAGEKLNFKAVAGGTVPEASLSGGETVSSRIRNGKPVRSLPTTIG